MGLASRRSHFDLCRALAIAMWLVLGALGHAQCQLTVRVIDEAGQLMPCRAWIESSGRRYFEPVAPETTTPYARDQSFSCDGEFAMDLPEGRAVLHVEKGKEFRPARVALDIPAQGSMQHTLRLERWIDMPSQGWYSADMHVHLGYDDPRVLAQLALADDVHLMPAFTYWLRGRGETWHQQWPDESYQSATRIDDRHWLTRNNLEIERIERTAEPGTTVGATFLFNLQRPVSAELAGEAFPTDAELCRIAREHSPESVFDSDKPSWAETVVGVGLGVIDTIQVCHNHYHRLATLDGGYGMIGPMAPGESNAATGDGLFHRTNELYYRFLNCGFQLGVSGGSAIGVMPLAAGQHRVYAQLDQELTPAAVWDAIKSGRSFATSGPMLWLTVNQQQIGSTIELDGSSPHALMADVRVQSIEPLESMELVHDGRVVASRDLRGIPAEPQLQSSLSVELTPRRSGWLAARALYRAPDGLLRQAHTSPIYLSWNGKPAAYATDAEYMLAWIDRLREVAERNPDRFPNAEIQEDVLATYAAAAERFREIRQMAIEHWNDL